MLCQYVTVQAKNSLTHTFAIDLFHCLLFIIINNFTSSVMEGKILSIYSTVTGRCIKCFWKAMQ